MASFPTARFGAEAEQQIRSSVAVAERSRAQALAARPPVETRQAACRSVDVTAVEPGFHLDVPLAFDQQLRGHRSTNPRELSAAAGSSRRWRGPSPPGAAGLRNSGARRLSSLVRDQDILGCDAGERQVRRRSLAGLAPQSRLRGGYHHVRAGERPHRADAEGRYDEISARSSPLFVGGTSIERWRRDVLKAAVEAEGFDVNSYEWWHFDYRGWQDYPFSAWTSTRSARRNEVSGSSNSSSLLPQLIARMAGRPQ